MCEVSVVMSAYNESESDLRMSIDSIVNQDFDSFEFLIVNDNPSNFALKKILSYYQKKYNFINVITNKENLGVSRSINKAIAASKGKYIMRMDADDASLPNRIKIEYNYLENNPDCSIVCGRVFMMDENSNVNHNYVGHTFKDSDLIRIMSYDNVIFNSTVMMRKEVLVKVGLYRDLPCAEDYDLFLRIISRGYKIHILSHSALLYYRIRQTSITRTDYARTFYISKYVLGLYKQRIRCGFDSYSKENVDTYLRKKISEKKRINIKQLFDILKNKEGYKTTIKITLLIIKDPSLFEVLIKLIVNKLMITIYREK